MKNTSNRRSWFWNWVVNNRLVSILTVTLLILLILLVLSKVSWLFTPVKLILDVIGLPLIIAGLLYYLLNPVVDWVERKWHVQRTWTILGLFLVVILFLIWGITSLIPLVQNQLVGFMKDWPHYWREISREGTVWLHDNRLNGIRDQLEQLNREIEGQASKATSSALRTTVSSVGTVVSRITSIVVALITAPFILFYLLRDGHKLPNYLAQLIPTRSRHSFVRVLVEMNQQVSNYVRGQIIVAFCVGVMFSIGFTIVGLPFGLMLGISAGILNLVPYLGSFFAMVPVVVIALFMSPWMLVKVLIVFMIEQTIEGRVISPLVLGSSLKIHPLTIMFILLFSGSAFGVPGVILGIPGYAVLKVVFSEFFDWYKGFSGLYGTPKTDNQSTGEEQA
ncbi:AI-2E family transporter [Levilactobacillus bambusae]|uniref:AI-2E family transporter n=1 Tax=Levilactobacillus bambusae TaxID=2024736 RepID=A0A2V1N3F7_9LACO|nr:AI-2E family transporter [Levilactobacillus bambusae]PWG00626.1 AI-2E family transporter [Levilactobacillus bambusae]